MKSPLITVFHIQLGGNAPRGDGSVSNFPYAVIVEKRAKCYNHRIT